MIWGRRPRKPVRPPHTDGQPSAYRRSALHIQRSGLRIRESGRHIQGVRRRIQRVRPPHTRSQVSVYSLSGGPDQRSEARSGEAGRLIHRACRPRYPTRRPESADSASKPAVRLSRHAARAARSRIRTPRLAEREARSSVSVSRPFRTSYLSENAARISVRRAAIWCRFPPRYGALMLRCGSPFATGSLRPTLAMKQSGAGFQQT